MAFTWTRLFVGMDLRDEGFYVLIPWRWALGDRPFVDEQNLAQISGLLTYPFMKVFGIVTRYDPTGLVLFTRHLYLLMMIGVAAAAFLLLRRLVRWQLALVISAVFATYLHWATPQLSYNTIGLAFLTLGATLGAWVVVEDGGRRYALAAGAAFGVAVVAYPSILFIVPFYAVFLVFALDGRAVSVVAHEAFLHPPDTDGPPMGNAAWRALSAWALGGALVLVPVGVVMLTAGVRNLVRSWEFTFAAARSMGQLGGASKAIEVTQGFWRFITWRPYLIVVAALIYLVYRRWPRLGRALLASLPVALWLVAQRPLLWGSGLVLLYALSAPYLYLFVPGERRETGAKLLIWIWAPALIAGAMTAYTSTFGYVNASVGLMPALLVSGLFLAWTLEAVSGAAATPWLALVALIAIVAVTIAFQFQFQQRAVAYGDLTSRFDSGPWWGIKVTPERRLEVDGLAADLQSQRRPGDSLLVFFEGSGYYLFWRGQIASNSYWLTDADGSGRLPQSTISYYRRHRIVPTLVVRLIKTEGLTDAQLRAASGGLGYPPTLVRPGYVFLRKPASESTGEVLAGLPRL